MAKATRAKVADASAAKQRRKISLVMPVFNEEGNVDLAYERLSALFERLGRYDLEFVFTDNHSEDRTFDKLAALAAKDPRVRVLRFNRNYGFQRSLLTGYRHSTGDAAVQIDCDLQDPPELIEKFLELWEKGHDVVVGIRRRRKEPALLTLGRRSFYSLLSRISEDEITRDAGDFRLVDRSVVERLNELNDFNPYVRGIVSALAVSEVGIPYDRDERRHGKSKFPVRRLFSFAMNGILGHSTIPLRLASYAGLLISTVTFVIGLFYLAGALFFGASWPSGFASIIVIVLFGISLNAIFLGIIGEYVSRIYQQVRYRPLVVVEKVINMAQGPSDK